MFIDPDGDPVVWLNESKQIWTKLKCRLLRPEGESAETKVTKPQVGKRAKVFAGKIDMRADVETSNHDSCGRPQQKRRLSLKRPPAALYETSGDARDDKENSYDTR